MKKYFPLIGFSLSLSLFIYVFYRTDKTVVNQLVILLFSKGNYHHAKELVNDWLPLREMIVYSLPEGLWVFCITLTSRFFRVRILGKYFNLAIVPLILAVLMELAQLFHFSPGRFDFSDLLFATVFWGVAWYFTDTRGRQENIRWETGLNRVLCLVSYGIVYLAHVMI